jgi:hypothetical protein
VLSPLLVVLLLLFEPPAPGSEVAADPPPPTEAHLRSWVADLGHPEFKRREDATTQLQQWGELALPRIRRAAVSSDPEVRIRCVQILARILELGSEAAALDAELALEELASLGDSTVRLRAGYVLDSFSEIRTERLIHRIQVLGGFVTRAEHTTSQSQQIFITEEWKGDDADFLRLARLSETDYAIYLIEGANVSDAARAQLVKMAPRMEFRLQTRGRVALGISNDSTPGVNGVKIGSPSPDGAAHRAGLRRDDVIIQIRDTKVTKFEDITEYVRKCKPGEPVPVTVLREGVTSTETLEFTIQPRPWITDRMRQERDEYLKRREAAVRGQTSVSSPMRQ